MGATVSTQNGNISHLKSCWHLHSHLGEWTWWQWFMLGSKPTITETDVYRNKTCKPQKFWWFYSVQSTVWRIMIYNIIWWYMSNVCLTFHQVSAKIKIAALGACFPQHHPAPLSTACTSGGAAAEDLDESADPTGSCAGGAQEVLPGLWGRGSARANVG